MMIIGCCICVRNIVPGLACVVQILCGATDADIWVVSPHETIGMSICNAATLLAKHHLLNSGQ